MPDYTIGIAERIAALADSTATANSVNRNYFQETRPEALFRDCSVYCETISDPDQMPRTLETAIRAAVGHRGVAVVSIPGDVALQALVVQLAAYFPGALSRDAGCQQAVAEDLGQAGSASLTHAQSSYERMGS